MKEPPDKYQDYYKCVKVPLKNVVKIIINQLYIIFKSVSFYENLKLTTYFEKVCYFTSFIFPIFGNSYNFTKYYITTIFKP